MKAVYLLYGRGMPSIERTITVERPIERTADPTIGVVQALSAALDEGVARISDEVIARLHEDAARVRAEQAQAAAAQGAAACAAQNPEGWKNGTCAQPASTATTQPVTD